jgi:phospholipid/cholesterol/gamma-HCH transport system permease protein
MAGAKGRMADEVWARLEIGQGATRLLLGGDWTLRNAGAAAAALPARDGQEPGPVVVDTSAVGAMDTTGAFLLSQWLRHAGASDNAAFAAGNPAHHALVERVTLKERQPLARPASPSLVLLARRTGRATFAFARAAANLLEFFGLVSVKLALVLLRPGRLRLRAVVAHVERIGLHALPILGLLSFLIGVVLAYQGADQLRAYGAEIFTVNLLGVSILRELGGLLTAILVAGRSGSAFAAEIGTMKVNEEVDAMRTMGLDPVEVLVLPRLLAMVVALPLLTIYASLMALAGGAVMVVASLGVTLPQFLNQLGEAVTLSTLWVGLSKAPVFALLIALAGCYEGLQVTGSAESVGRQTTKSVVEAIFLVIVADAFFSILFAQLGL